VVGDYTFLAAPHLCRFSKWLERRGAAAPNVPESENNADGLTGEASMASTGR
jgi:hypothetical protein